MLSRSGMMPRDGTGLQALREWLTGAALPCWIEQGFDAAAGRFHERLGLNGAPVAVPHRAMVQARQIFVYAEAARLGWIDPGDAPERAMHALIRDYAERSDGCTSFAFAVHVDGRVASATRDAYAHAFVLLALSSLHALTGERRLLLLAEEITAFIDRHLIDQEHEGLLDKQPNPPPFKRQNPAMHLLEAYLALEEVQPGAGYLERASGLVALFSRRMFRNEQAVLPEYFAHDWSLHPDPDLGHFFEPGHHFEWAWLLDEHARLSGRAAPERHQLFHTARSLGLSPAGAIFDQVDIASRQPRGGHRLWPHTEAIKAALARQAGGDAEAAAFADGMAVQLLKHFLGRPFPCGWMDHVDSEGRALVDFVPASSLYHIARAVFEHDRRRKEAGLPVLRESGLIPPHRCPPPPADALVEVQPRL